MSEKSLECENTIFLLHMPYENSCVGMGAAEITPVPSAGHVPVLSRGGLPQYHLPELQGRQGAKKKLIADEL